MATPVDILLKIVQPLEESLVNEIVGLVHAALSGHDVGPSAERIKNITAAKAAISAAAEAKRETLRNG